MWSDNETTEDLLGFKVHADLIIDVIKDDKVLPVTIGVFGDWGSGKSSILKITKEELEKLDEKTFVLYFNGWVFEGYDDAKAALLESIVKAFDEHKSFGFKVKDKTTKLFKSVKWMRVLGFGFKKIVLPTAAAYFSGETSLLLPILAEQLSKATGSPEDLIKKLQGEGTEEYLKSLIKENQNDESTLVRDFRNDFADLIKKSSIQKLVVIIDDLDRCTPDRIIENLEAIKLFLNVEKTAFVIGADPRIVRNAIEHRYKSQGKADDDSNSRLVDDYLEKLIQVPYYLPKLSDSEVETYISLLVSKRELSDEVFIKIKKAFHTFRQGNRYSVFGLANIKGVISSDEHQALSNSLISIPALVPVITQTLSGNPRQIKRFLNTLTLRQRLASVAKLSNFNDAVLAKLMVLEYSELQLFKQLYEWQISQQGVPKQLAELETACKDKSFEEIKQELDSKIDLKNWSRDKVIRWFKVEPFLKNVDLSDYFWLSRDKLSSTIPGSSLISPIVKGIYQKLDQEIMTLSVTKKIVNEELKSLKEPECTSFLELASQMLKRNPKKKRAYDIFHALIDENITGADTYYGNTIVAIKITEIPTAVGLSLKNYQSNPALKDFLENVLQKSDSLAAKAFKNK